MFLRKQCIRGLLSKPFSVSLSRSLCINVCVVYIGIGILVLAFFEFPDSFVASDER